MFPFFKSLINHTECIFVCVCERETTREEQKRGGCVCARERVCAHERVCVCVCVCV